MPTTKVANGCIEKYKANNQGLAEVRTSKAPKLWTNQLLGGCSCMRDRPICEMYRNQGLKISALCKNAYQYYYISIIILNMTNIIHIYIYIYIYYVERPYNLLWEMWSHNITFKK